jgi:hypothetical protein
MKIFFKALSLMIALLLALSLLGAFASCNVAESEEDAADKGTEVPAESQEDAADKGTEVPTEAPTKAPPADPPVEISAEMQSEIKNKWFEKTYVEEKKEYYNSPDQVKIEACYGIFDDAYCILIDDPLSNVYPMVEVNLEVGEYTFTFGHVGLTMDIYCNGEFYGLKQAYENGILDDTELESLHYYYTKSKMEHHLKTTYFLSTYDEKEHEYYNSPDQVTIEACYGIFDDAYCAIITYPLVEYPCEVTEVEVGGYTFVFGSTNTMKVYCDGQIYSLEKAYEKGILDDAELKSLYNNYTKARG